MFWFLYITTSVLLSAILALLSKKYTVQVFLVLLAIFMTPAQIEIQNSDYAPSLFTFLFNLVFEQSFSFRTLRPLVITLPITVFLLSIYMLIKRKFF